MDEVHSAAFVGWARERAVPLTIPRSDDSFDDLGFFASVLGTKRIVAVGESAHYLHEWNRWRARLFKHLALEHGFTTFVLECGLIEGRLVHQYVAGLDVEWDRIAAAINNVWGVWGEINDLIRWMREWNAEPDRPRELRFYPMDGTGNWTNARHAYQAVHEFFRRVDDGLARDFENDFERSVEEVTLETRASVEPARFRNLVGAATLAVSRIEQGRLAYTAATSFDDYDWALRSAQVFRDVLQALAQTDTDFDVGVRQLWNVRDVSMAESLHWIRTREGMDAGMVVGAHNTHLQLHPVRVQKATSMGSYYAARFGRDDVLFIGAASEQSLKRDAPTFESNQAAYGSVGLDCYFLDLREAPSTGPVAAWLNTERPDRSNLRYQPVCPGAAWDCLLFHRTVTHAKVELPGYLDAGPETLETDVLATFVGRYVVRGFLAAVNTLDVYLDGDTLFTDGRDDTSGELFPPYRAALRYGDDDRFRWEVFPTIIEFHRGDAVGTVTMWTPGGSIYHGRRVSAEPGG